MYHNQFNQLLNLVKAVMLHKKSWTPFSVFSTLLCPSFITAMGIPLIKDTEAVSGFNDKIGETDHKLYSGHIFDLCTNSHEFSSEDKDSISQHHYHEHIHSKSGSSTKDSRYENMSPPALNHPARFDVKDKDMGVSNQEYLSMPNILHHFYAMEDHNLLSLSKVNVENPPQTSHPEYMVEHHQQISPQNQLPTAQFIHQSPFTPDTIFHGPTAGTTFGSMDQSRQLGGDTASLSTDDFPISDFEVCDNVMNSGNTINSAEKTLQQIKINSHSDSYETRHPNLLNKLYPPILLSRENLGYQSPSQSNISTDSSNPQTLGLFHNQLFEGANFLSTHLPATKNNLFTFGGHSPEPEQYTLANSWSATSTDLPSTSNHLSSMDFDGLNNADVGKAKIISSLNTNPRIVHEDNQMNNLYNPWGGHSDPLMSVQSLQNPHQNSGWDNPFVSLDLHEMIHSTSEPRMIPGGIQPELCGNLDKGTISPDNLWNTSQEKGLQDCLRVQEQTHRFDETLLNDLIMKREPELKDEVIDHKRKKRKFGQSSKVGSTTTSNSDKVSYTQHDGAYMRVKAEDISSEDSLCSLPNVDINPFTAGRFDSTNALGSRRNSKDTSILTINRVHQGNIQNVNDLRNKGQPTGTQAILHDTNKIYKNQPRSSIDLSIEKHLIPFMSQLEEFFRKETNLIQRSSPDILGNRLRLITHEFLLLLVKTKLTYDLDEEELNVTLLEGYQWLKHIWKSIPMKTFILNDVLRTNQSKGFPTKRIEHALLSKLAEPAFFSRNHHYFLAYTMLKWIQQFRPQWFEIYKTTTRVKFEKTPGFQYNLHSARHLLSCINKHVPGMQL
ncbi:hypothetical protein DFH28DRAFT_1110866 [Melampsora americana]|nr:hypothetical protein DFH28DRAFT_1110866 [Melampsora americana]